MVRKNEYLTKVDKYIGAKIYNLRIAQGYSRKQLSELINVSNQQLHKYEIGVNRICLGRLMMVAKALAQNIEYFYEGVDRDCELNFALPFKEDSSQRLSIEIARNIRKIENDKIRIALKFLTKAIIEEEEEEEAEPQ